MEKFKGVKDHIFKLASDYKCWDNRLTDDEALELCHILEQEPQIRPKGHWINKHRLLDSCSCSAECSSCHKRSKGYMRDSRFGLVSTYYDFCPKCGSDNREVEE